MLTNRYSHGFVSCVAPQACGGLPGNLLYWGVIQGEIEAGIPFLDLGAQSLSQQPGLTMAKRSFSPPCNSEPLLSFDLARWQSSVSREATAWSSLTAP